MDLSLDRIEAAVEEIDPVFLDTPQFVSAGLSEHFGREVVVKVETLNPIGSFKGRGTCTLGRRIERGRTWVCATAGNFGQGVAYAARANGDPARVFVGPSVPAGKVERIRALGAHVEVSADAEAEAREFAVAGSDRMHVVDGLDPAIAEGAGTVGLELEAAGPFDAVVVQVGDGALITGVARWLKARAPETRVVGVCSSAAPAMVESFAAGRAVSAPKGETAAGPIATRDPVPESVARMLELVDDVVAVDDAALREAVQVIADAVGVLAEPAGAAGVAALARHGERIGGGRVAVVITGAQQ